MLVKFIVVLSFWAGHNLAITTINCPDQACVDKIHEDSYSSSNVSRFRVFDADTYGVNPVGRQSFMPPLVDESRL